MWKWLGWVVVLALAGTAGFELALALGAGSLGPEPGDNVPGATALLVVAVLAMLVGGGIAVTNGRLRVPAAALLAPAAAAFVVALYFTFDPYYAPNERRYSDGGIVPLGWIVAVGVAAVVAGVLTRLSPRLGAVATPLVLVVLMGTILFMGTGH